MALKSLVKSAIYPLYERRLLKRLDLSKTPRHVGVILDGNRRWSRENPSRTGDISPRRGHEAGAGKILELLAWCEEVEIEVVTLWLLSSDNFNRKSEEIASLLEIINDAVERLRATGRWKIRPLGSFELLPDSLQKNLREVEASTSGISGITVNVAIGYGGRLEIIDAVKRFIVESATSGKNAREIGELVSAEKIDQFLYTAGQPDPELVIRTSGEQRLGGFLLWQTHQSEFYFCEAYWPDFRKVDFLRALRSYSMRQRRLGR